MVHLAQLLFHNILPMCVAIAQNLTLSRCYDVVQQEAIGPSSAVYRGAAQACISAPLTGADPSCHPQQGPLIAKGAVNYGARACLHGRTKSAGLESC